MFVHCGFDCILSYLCKLEAKNADRENQSVDKSVFAIQGGNDDGPPANSTTVPFDGFCLFIF